MFWLQKSPLAFGEPQGLHGGGETLCGTRVLLHCFGAVCPSPQGQKDLCRVTSLAGEQCSSMGCPEPSATRNWASKSLIAQEQLSFTNASCQHLARGSGL